jgi:hypothetical protein
MLRPNKFGRTLMACIFTVYGADCLLTLEKVTLFKQILDEM